MYRLCSHLLCEQDLTVEEIAEQLLSMGIRARHVHVWHPVFLSRLLSNPLYTGQRDYTDKAGVTHTHPVPPLISREQFERAQAVLHAHSRDARAHATGTTPALLRRMVRCGECGEMYTTTLERNQAPAYRIADGQPGRWRCYMCTTKHNRSRFYRRNAPGGA